MKKKLIGFIGIAVVASIGVQTFKKALFKKQLKQLEKEAAFDEVLKSLDKDPGPANSVF